MMLRLLALLLLLSRPALAEEHEAAPKKEAPKEAAKEGGEEGGKAAKAGEPTTYVNLAPMILPVIGDNGPEQLVTLAITLEAVDADKTEEIKKKLPRLNDAYLQTLYGALDTRSINRGSLIDITRVKQRLQAPTERVLGKDVVKEILVQAVAQRKL